MGCRIINNAKEGAYDNNFAQINNFPEKLCSGNCVNCPHYYEEKSCETCDLENIVSVFCINCKYAAHDEDNWRKKKK